MLQLIEVLAENTVTCQQKERGSDQNPRQFTYKREAVVSPGSWTGLGIRACFIISGKLSGSTVLQLGIMGLACPPAWLL